MYRYLLQLAALLIVVGAATLIYWRSTATTSSHAVASPAAGTTSTPAGATATPGGQGTPARPTPTAANAAPVLVSWPGGSARYLGRYRLVGSSDAGLAQSGELTIFLRKNVPHQPKPVLSGILTLYGTEGTNVFYLTHFAHQGTRLWTQLSLGIYTGPLIGQFAVQAIQGERLTAELVQQGQTPIKLTLVRFSKNPHP